MTPEELKEIDERIAVMKARKEGKVIQCRAIGWAGADWTDITAAINWDFGHFEYRVKPESHYRPFNSAKEVYEAVKEHGLLLKSKIFVDEYYTIIAIGSSFINAGSNHGYSFEESMEATMFADGTPFGFKEE